jgi:hypothetical protein
MHVEGRRCRKRGVAIVKFNGRPLRSREDVMCTYYAPFDWGDCAARNRLKLAVAILCEAYGEWFARRHAARLCKALRHFDRLGFDIDDDWLAIFARGVEDEQFDDAAETAAGSDA